MPNSTVQATFLKVNAKTLEHPGPCSVLGAGHYSRTGVGGGGWSLFLIYKVGRYANVQSMQT